MCKQSVDRTTRWLARCKTKMAGAESDGGYHQSATSCCLASIRGPSIRRYPYGACQSGSAEMDLDGYAMGGLAVGETHEEMYHILEETVPYLPQDKPTYLMGVGTPANILEGVERGVDFFDCVYPSRNGRHGHVYTNHGKLNLLNARYELDDKRRLKRDAAVRPAGHYSRAYIRHLLKAKEMLGMRLCVLHNLYFYNTMMAEIRTAIEEGRYQTYKKAKLAGI